MQCVNQKSEGEPLPRGVRRRYEIARGGNSIDEAKPFLICDTEKSFLRGITRFHCDGLNVGFLSATNRQGTAWELEDVDGRSMGYIIARETPETGWRLSTPQHRNFDLYDQADVGKDILRSTLGSWPDAYACIEGAQEVGAIRREERHHSNGSGGGERRRSGRPSFLGRLKKLMITHDWVFSHTANVSPSEELLLIAGMLTIMEVTVPGHHTD